MTLSRSAALICQVWLLVLGWILLAPPVLASYQGELYLDLEAPEETLPAEVCLRGGSGVMFESEPACLGDSSQNRTLVLEAKADFGDTGSQRMSAKLISYHQGHVHLRYESQRRPEVVTFSGAAGARCTDEKNDRYHPITAVNWLPVMGTRPAMMPVVPCRIDVEIEFPEYECLEGAKVDRRRAVPIDPQWQVPTDQWIEGCGENAPGAATFRFPENTSIKALHAVPVVPIGMRIAWRPNALSEAPQRPGGVQLTPARSWMCGAAAWNAAQKRFEWSCGTSAPARTPSGRGAAATPPRLDFPTRFEMSVVGCDRWARKCPGSWTDTLRYPGQVLTGQIEAAAQTLVVEWDGWCAQRPGRAHWTMDRILAVEVETTTGTKLSFVPPLCGKRLAARAWTRQPLPGLQPDEPLKVSYWGTRRFRSGIWSIEACGHTEPGRDSPPSPNCLVLRPPEAQTRTGQRRLSRDRATVGVGLAGGLYGTWVSSKDFYGPISEVHLNVLVRGLHSGAVRLDLDLRGVVSFQSWSAYRCRGSCEPGETDDLTGNFERAERQRDSMLSARFQPALRLAAFHDVFFGAHPIIGYGAPPIRRGGNEQVPLQMLFGAGVSVAWYISPAVAFEIQGNWTAAVARFLTLDPSGLVSSVEGRAQQLSGLFGLRFDDLAGD